MARGKIIQRFSKTQRAGIIFPVARVHRLLKKGRYAKRVSATAAIYLSSVLEYLCAEVLDLSHNASSDNKKTRITPRFLQLAIRFDTELDELLSNVTIAEGGVVPHIDNSLLPINNHINEI